MRVAEDLGCREQVEQELRRALDGWVRELTTISPTLAPLGATTRQFVLEGGKRLRPAFAWWGWRGAGGQGSGDAVLPAVAALELIHACALVHDDVMDASATRRGAPAVHEQFAARHRAEGRTGAAAAYGTGAAILIGDLLLVWADRLFAGAPLPAADRARAQPAYDALRTEVMAGQMLDLLAQSDGVHDVVAALRVARFKSASYTVQRPLEIGARLADAPAELLRAYDTYGLAVGTAFQLRDDLLGVFGDPVLTGKPNGDDLREGKRTVLVALAWERGNASTRRLLEQRLGDPALDATGVAALQEAIAASGAGDHVETMIEQRWDEGLAALDDAPMDPEARAVLVSLARQAAMRTA